jgi:hypothetical protein
MVLTDSRVIVIKAGAMAGNIFGVKTSSFPLSEIASVEFEKRMGTSYLMIRTAGSSVAMPRRQGSTSGYELPNVIPLGNDRRVQLFIRAVHMVKTASTSEPVPSVPSGTLLDDLERLGRLQAAGGLTAGEFAAAKARLIEGR